MRCDVGNHKSNGSKIAHLESAALRQRVQSARWDTGLSSCDVCFGVIWFGDRISKNESLRGNVAWSRSSR
jgi:hypothetical protein